jgi:hypothetical protein
LKTANEMMALAFEMHFLTSPSATETADGGSEKPMDFANAESADY